MRVSAQEQTQDSAKPSTADKPAADPSSPQTTASPVKTAEKARKVFTNDDIKSSPYASFGGLFYVNTGSINDCDLNCFEQTRAFAQVDPNKNPDWRRDALQQIELVRSDSEWQAYLRDLYGAHGKICQINFDKADELRRSGSSRNLGPLEIAITEKYDAKTKIAEAELASDQDRQNFLQKKFRDKPYAFSFAILQALRIRGGFCSQGRVIYAQ
jgi:hypothetical protein